MENIKNKKFIIAGAIVLVIVIAAIIALVASCNSGSKDGEGDTLGSEDSTYESIDELSSEDIESEEESIILGDNEVPFDDAAAESTNDEGNTGETKVYEVTEPDGSIVTEADGSVVTTVAYIPEEEFGDNEVSFGEDTTASSENNSTESATEEEDTTEADTETVEESSGDVVEVETDSDGWTTDIVKP